MAVLEQILALKDMALPELQKKYSEVFDGESAENYINSQKSEGWIASPEKYDDGGYTGANTERPALQKLIADIKEGKTRYPANIRHFL